MMDASLIIQPLVARMRQLPSTTMAFSCVSFVFVDFMTRWVHFMQIRSLGLCMANLKLLLFLIIHIVSFPVRGLLFVSAWLVDWSVGFMGSLSFFFFGGMSWSINWSRMRVIRGCRKVRVPSVILINIECIIPLEYSLAIFVIPKRGPIYLPVQAVSNAKRRIASLLWAYMERWMHYWCSSDRSNFSQIF